MAADSTPSHQQPFDLLDLLLLLLIAPLHPLCLALVVGQWFLRRSAAVAGSLVDLLESAGAAPALADHRFTRALLPGLLLPEQASEPVPGPLLPSTSPVSLTDAAPISAVPAVLDQPTVALPGIVDLANLLRDGFTPTPQRILLGVGPGGALHTTDAVGLCHVAFCGATGSGKTNLHRLILPQLLAIGARVWLADPHHAPLDPENGDDWRAIVARLDRAPAVRPGQIDHLFDALITELDRRLERRARGERVGPPLFFAFDELPVIVDSVKGASERLARVLREGRKVKLLTVGASQDFLCKTIGGSSAIRDCYRTAYYVGGDRISAALLCDIPQREIDDGPLGGGVALLRSTATSPARQVRVPLASNAAIAMLLGAAYNPASEPSRQPTEWLTPGVQTIIENQAGSQPEASPMLPASPLGSTNLDPEQARIITLFREGKSVAEVVSIIYNSPSSGRRYQDLRAKVEGVIRSSMIG